MIVTQHFETEEFDCHDGTLYPTAWVPDRLLPLCLVLEELRRALGGHRVHITSGYRTVLYNDKIGGARHSQHVSGRAADIEVEGYAPSDVHRVVLDLYHRGKIKIGGLGLYESWIHIDIRESDHLVRWTGKGLGSEVV